MAGVFVMFSACGGGSAAVKDTKGDVKVAVAVKPAETPAKPVTNAKPAAVATNVKPVLSGLYLTSDAKQMTGVGMDNTKLAVGESVVIYARGKDAAGKWYELPADVVVNWKADKELKVEPATGKMVTVKVAKEIAVSAMVTATVTDSKGKKIEAIFTIAPKPAAKVETKPAPKTK